MSYIQTKTSAYKSIKKDIKLLQLRGCGASGNGQELKPAQEWLEKLKAALGS